MYSWIVLLPISLSRDGSFVLEACQALQSSLDQDDTAIDNAIPSASRPMDNIV